MKQTFLLIIALFLLPLAARAGQTEFIFLVTGDGIRHQEVFTGADPTLLAAENKKSSGVDDLKRIRDEFWHDDPIQRREKTMPFFWKSLSKQGVIFGNRALGSSAVVRNPHHFSYPGYAEILNGQPLAEINSNDPVWSPRETLLEFVRRERNLQPEQVAMFGSWNIFNWIAMSKDGAVFCNAGYESIAPKLRDDSFASFLDSTQSEILSPWDSVRHDAVTLGLALGYIQKEKPKFFYLALGETDDWAHDRRYDRVLQSLRYFDLALERLWTLLQSTEPYRGKTTLIVTTDHGRGSTLENWTSHSKDTPGSDQVWIALFGPDTPATGEAKNTDTYSLSNVASTALKLLGIDPPKFNPSAAPPIQAAFR